MQLIKFETDYQEGCHPEILKRLSQTNFEQTSGYGIDPHCENAVKLIKNFIGLNDENSKIYFLVGGTQTNTTVIKNLLRPTEGVICAQTGHINIHESGAIESTGHKILTLPSRNGLLNYDEVRKYLQDFYSEPTCEHMVQPGLIYISYSSELGTLYKKNDLENFRKICDEYNLKLFLDGARLGAGLTSEKSDLNINDIAKLCDVFYIGGTKNGALFGEAVVFPDSNKIDTKNFRTLIKQQGGLLAKGRLLGVQFETLFENEKNNLYLEIAKHENLQAMKIKNAFINSGIKLFIDSYTNQQFPILNNSQNKILSQKFSYELWQKIDDDNSAYRFCTSWATSDENINKLINEIKNL